MRQKQEKPIIFSAPMIRAILQGQKTQTRRIAKLNLSGRVKEVGSNRNWHCDDPNALLACPYGGPGKLLWARETWKPDCQGDISVIRYRADESMVHINNTREAAEKWVITRRPEEQWPQEEEPKWRPSIHMPRWASRITLKITDVRVERLQDITEDDARAEGCKETHLYNDLYFTAYAQFGELWGSINGPGSWDENPWVWALEFEVIKQNVDQVMEATA